jgi:hypothetical protein
VNRLCSLALGCALLLGVTCQADDIEVLYDGTSLTDWSTQRDSERLRSEFSLAETTIAGTPPYLQWRFISKGVAFNDLFLMRTTPRPFTTIRVRVRNVGTAFDLGAKVRDASSAEWTAGNTRLPAGGDWQWVEFPWDQWHVASWSSDADGVIDFPLQHFTLIAFGVKAGPEYCLQLSRIEVVRPDPPVATVTVFSIPSELAAGQTVTVPVRFSLDKPCLVDEAVLSFRRNGKEAFRVPLGLAVSPTKAEPGAEYDLAARVAVPQFAWGGPHDVAVVIGEARTRRPGEEPKEALAQVNIQARKTTHTIAEVKLHNGTPTLFINGQPSDEMTWASYQPAVEVFSDFTKAGVNLFTFSATPTEAGYNLSKTVWVAPDEWDYSQLDQRMMMVLQANPNAYIFPRLYLHAPKWWSDQHPDDVVQFDPGDGKPQVFIHSGQKPAPCWASEAWRKDTAEGLRRLIAHIEASPYADRVIGYHIASGTTEEWMMWGSNENEWVDYSPANHKAFRQWLRNRYQTVDRLRAAWGKADVDFDTASVPTKAERAASGLGALRDPASEQASIDYYWYNSDMVADTICFFARTVKDLTGRQKITGAFYGYLLQLCGEQRQQNAGHLALDKVMACPDLDFLTSPTSYAFRQLGGEGTSHFMSLWGSIKLHGKLWFNENDVRTSEAPGQPGTWGRPTDAAGDILQQDKELANAFVNGTAQWWFDVGGNRYRGKEILDRIALHTRRAKEVVQVDRAPADQVAFVVDESSLPFLRVGSQLGAHLLVRQLPALRRMGAPSGDYLVEDLPHLASQRLLIFPTSFAPTAADRAAIDALKGDGRVLVFLWADGYYRDGKPDLSAMESLTGIRMTMSREPSALQVTIAGDQPLTQGLAGAKYGADGPVWPVFWPDDPAAKVLGTLPDGRPGLVVKDFGTWKAVYSAAPLLPAALLRALGQAAGVHSYIDTEDVVWASRDLVGVSVFHAGKRTIRLPRRAAVRDLFTGETLSGPTEQFDAEFAERQTRVFVLEGNG